MTARIIFCALSSFCLASASTGVFAVPSPLPSAPPNNDGGYQSATTNPGYPSPTVPAYSKHVSISVNMPAPTPNTPVYVTRTYPRGKELLWVNMWPHNVLPRDAVVSGNQPNPPYTLYVCRGQYRGGVHPGKLVGTRCNIGWGGQEIRLSNYQVLVSRIGLGWVSSNNGYIPVNAIEGGQENGHPLYICQADYNGGMHTGKVVGRMCNIGFGGREISVPYYNVLVR